MRELADLCIARLRQDKYAYIGSYDPMSNNFRRAFGFRIETGVRRPWSILVAVRGDSAEEAILAAITLALRHRALDLARCSAAERRCIEATVRAWEIEKEESRQ